MSLQRWVRQETLDDRLDLAYAYVAHVLFRGKYATMTRKTARTILKQAGYEREDTEEEGS